MSNARPRKLTMAYMTYKKKCNPPHAYSSTLNANI